jgi:large subunit ribosomal protein L13
MKSYMPNASTVDRKWVIVDAKDQILGRLATQVASILMGKNKTTYSPHVACGDHVIILNAKQIKVTGKKTEQKLYRSHTGYPGGFKEVTLKTLMEKKPEEVIRKAVQRMLPHNNLGRQLMKNVRIFVDDKHEHQAQQPVEANL